MICSKCFHQFTPKVHKKWQKYCDSCKTEAYKSKKRISYLNKRDVHTSIRLSRKNHKIVKKLGLSLGVFVNQRISALGKALEDLDKQKP